jgi:hypothetical protein
LHLASGSVAFSPCFAGRLSRIPALRLTESQRIRLIRAPGAAVVTMFLRERNMRYAPIFKYFALSRSASY